MTRIVFKHKLDGQGQTPTDIPVGVTSILRGGAVTPDGLCVWVEHEVDDSQATGDGVNKAIVLDGVLQVMAVLTGRPYGDEWNYHSMVSAVTMSPKGPKLSTWHLVQNLVSITFPDELPADFK